MPFSTVLTIISAHADETDLDLAADFAEREGRHLSVLVLAIAPTPPMVEAAGTIADVWIEQRRLGIEAVEQRTAAIAAQLARRPISADVASDYVDAAIIPEIVGRRARYADMTMAGPALLADEELRDPVLEGALFFSGRPLLVVPRGRQPSLAPKRVIVGWDSRVESARAVREAMEMLATADEVRLTIVDPVRDEYHHGEEPGADAASYLARHGARVTVDRVPSENRSVADVLRRSALDADADMMVIGAYGHSRLRERIFGGVTRSLLHHPSLPTFLAR
ncbi:MAG: universal stress protein [Rhizobiaceae bacterium]|nr:universal stress protein [Rhizobiaceae bacterium]